MKVSGISKPVSYVEVETDLKEKALEEVLKDYYGEEIETPGGRVFARIVALAISNLEI